MFAALHLPDFHLQAQLRLRPEWEDLPTALLDGPGPDNPSASARDRGKSRVLQLTREATAARVEPGMTATRALARCPGLLLLPRQPDDEATAAERLQECAASVTADFEATGPGLVILDLHGVRDDPRKLAADRIAWLRGFRLSARAGIAGNPDLAVLAARLAGPGADSEPVLVLDGSPGRIRELLAPLPVTALQPPPEWRELFRLWGIRTAGDLAALPRHELTERLGPAAGRLRDQALGQSHRLLRLVRPPEQYRESLDLDDPVGSAEALLFLLRRFLDRITARLATSWLVAGALDLQLAIEGHPPHRRTLRLPDPTRDEEILSRLLQTHLESFTAPGPVVAVSLEAIPARPTGGQTQLFASSWKDPNRLSDTLARLEAQLGPDRVGIPVPGWSHRPDSFRHLPFSPQAAPAAASPAHFADGPVRSGPPLRRFRPRRPVSVGSRPWRGGERPEAILAGPLQGTLSEPRGPWHASGDWWTRTGWEREEWDVRHESGTLYRLSREAGRWYVEGAYD